MEEICTVDGIDVIHVGSSDLLTATGMPGAFGSPQHLDAVNRIVGAAKKHGKAAGVGGDHNIPRQMDFIRGDARFLITNSDAAFMLAGASRVTGELCKALG